MPFKLRYTPALDGLRAIAILMVMAHHAGVPFTAGGQVGVTLFFVLSGFLITALLIKEHEEQSRINLKHFYLRRCLRLAPALVMMLAAYLAYCAVIRPAGYEWWQPALYSALYISNYVSALGHADAMGPLVHTWSLSVEEQFYITWPVLLAFALHRNIPKQTILNGVIGLILAVSIWRVWLSYVPMEDAAKAYRTYMSFDTRADSLLIGCLTALALSWQRVPTVLTRTRILNSLAALSAAILCVCLVRYGWTSLWMERAGYLLSSISAALMILFVYSNPPRWFTGLLERKYVVAVGMISYGLYLWHVPIFTVMTSSRGPWLVTHVGPWVASFAAAGLSWFLVERPANRLKRHFR